MLQLQPAVQLLYFCCFLFLCLNHLQEQIHWSLMRSDVCQKNPITSLLLYQMSFKQIHSLWWINTAAFCLRRLCAVLFLCLFWHPLSSHYEIHNMCTCVCIEVNRAESHPPLTLSWGVHSCGILASRFFLTQTKLKGSLSTFSRLTERKRFTHSVTAAVQRTGLRVSPETYWVDCSWWCVWPHQCTPSLAQSALTAPPGTILLSPPSAPYNNNNNSSVLFKLNESSCLQSFSQYLFLNLQK